MKFSLNFHMTSSCEHYENEDYKMKLLWVFNSLQAHQSRALKWGTSQSSALGTLILINNSSGGIENMLIKFADITETLWIITFWRTCVDFELFVTSIRWGQVHKWALQEARSLQKYKLSTWPGGNSTEEGNW